METGGIGNAPISKPTAQTGLLTVGVFLATQNPQEQPEMMGFEADEGIRQRDAMVSQGGLKQSSRTLSSGYLIMAANPKDPRTKRRKAAGDDPNKMSVAPQPIPGMPQGQGNMMNYPAEDVAGQMGQRMGSGPYQFPYGDLVSME